MKADGRLVDEIADAILDGTSIDWAAAEPSAEGVACPVVRNLKVLAAVADLHRGAPPIASTLSEPRESLPERRGEDVPENWGHLRVFEQVGRGASGEVYRAWDTRLDREVALKLLPASRGPDDRAPSSIIQEGRLLARVRHPNVVTIHGAEQIGDRIGLWMEFVRGHTLEQLLQQQTVFSAAEVVEVGLEVCRAVTAVHGAGLLHRDIKAHNVMRAGDGRIVLMDFGAGREREDDTLSDLAGTPLYLAPEVLRGQPATVQSEIYSLGVLLYHLVTGSYPVHARTVREVRRAHERGERTAVRSVRRDVSPKLSRVIERAIDPRPERRHDSADALNAELAVLRPRPRIVRLAYTAGVAGALVLLATVSWEVAGRQVQFSRTPGVLLAGFVGLNPVRTANLDPAERPIIAVLPLRNLGAEPDSDYFVEGLTDEVIRNLAVIKGLEVRSRTSSFALRDKPLRDIAQQLGVNLVVEGSIVRSGRRLRINARLVRVAGEVPLWSEQFERELEDIFAIQDEISRSIVNKLQLTLDTGQRRYNANLEAYELYLKARDRVDERSTFPAQQAVSLFERAIDKDPSFALAYAGLAEAYAAASEEIPGPFRPSAILPATALALMAPAAETALQLDPLLAEAHAAMGLLYSRRLDWERAEESFRRAIELNPSLTQIYTSYSFSTLVPLGKLAEAEKWLRTAFQSDPLSLSVQRELAELQFITGRYEEAVASLERIRAVDPDFSNVDRSLTRALTFAGRPLEALRVLETKKTHPGMQHWMARAYVMAGQRAEVERLAATHDHPYRLAVIYAALGDNDRVFTALDQAIARVPQRVGLLLQEPEVAALRGDPRFAAVRRKLRLP